MNRVRKPSEHSPENRAIAAYAWERCEYESFEGAFALFSELCSEASLTAVWTAVALIGFLVFASNLMLAMIACVPILAWALLAKDAIALARHCFRHRRVFRRWPWKI